MNVGHPLWSRIELREAGKREAIEVSVPNVELNWRMTPEMMTETRIYAQQMLEMKQIRALPDFDVFLDPKFSDEVAKQS